MIYDVTVKFDHNGIEHTLALPNDTLGDSDNLPFNIAEMVKQLIHFSDANPDIIIKDLIDEYDYKEEDV